MQGEYFNTYVCKVLEDYYSRMRNKLSIDPISQKNVQDGFFYNQRGAKCYFDAKKQPMLSFPQHKNLYHVLSIGFDCNTIPLVTIAQDGKPYCYRLPQELGEWAYYAVVLANMGENCFPADVVFTKERGQVFANIL